MTAHVARRTFWLRAASAAAALALAGCAVGPASGAQERGDDSGGTLTVLAASSLTDAFTELSRMFEKRYDADVRVSFAGSSTLAAQILQGAPAGVFASANPEQMQRVGQAGLVVHGPKTFVKNREVIVVPDDNPAAIQELRDLAEPGVRLVLAADGVPAAEYAEQIFTDAESRYGGDFRERVLGNLRSREADVRAAVYRVVMGDADATLGYASDVTPDIRDEVRVVEIPPSLNVVAKYPIAVLEGVQDKELGRKWTRFVRSDTGQRVLRKWGFQPVRSP